MIKTTIKLAVGNLSELLRNTGIRMMDGMAVSSLVHGMRIHESQVVPRDEVWILDGHGRILSRHKLNQHERA